MAWTLQRNSGTPQTFAAWGLSAPKIRKLNQSAGTLTCALTGNALADIEWVYNDLATVRRDSTVVWRGYFHGPKRIMNGIKEGIALEFRDPWEWFNLGGAYAQPIFSPALGANVNQTCVNLFAEITPGVSWIRRTVADEIANVVAQANARHGTFCQLGTLNATFNFSPDPRKMRDAAFSQVLRACLEFVPDAVTSWDFSTTPPTLNIKPRTAATTRSFAIGTDALVTSELLPRHDLQVDGVQFNWIYEVDDGSGQFEITATTETAGSMSGPRVLQQTITLTPPRATPPITETVTVESETFDVEDFEFWKKWGGLPANALPAPTDPVGPGTTLHNPDGFTKKFIGGSIPSWMNDEAHFSLASATGFINYLVPNAAGTGYDKRSDIITVDDFVVTDLGGNYTRTVVAGSVEPGDEPTTGLAAHFYSLLSVLQYEGVIELQTLEITSPLECGDLINLTNGRAEWATMAAQVHQLTWDIDGGKVTAEVGPSKHLSVADFIELQRASSKRELATALDRVTTGVGGASEGGNIKGSTAPKVPQPPKKDTVAKSESAKDGESPDEWKREWAVQGGTQKNEKTDASKLFEVDTNAGKLTLKHAGEAEKSLVIDVAAGTLVLKRGVKEFSINLETMEALFKESEHKLLTLKPNQVVASNAEAEKVTLSALTGLKHEVTEGDEATLSAAAGFKQTKADGSGSEASATQLKTFTSTTNSFTITPGAGAVHATSAGDQAKLGALAGMVVQSSTGDKVEAKPLTGFVNNKSGKTMAASAEDGVSHDDGPDTATLKATEIKVTDGTDTAKLTAAEGYHHEQGAFTLTLGADAGYDNQGSGGFVKIAVQSAKEIELRQTEFCDEDGSGNPITKQAHVLRGVTETI